MVAEEVEQMPAKKSSTAETTAHPPRSRARASPCATSATKKRGKIPYVLAELREALTAPSQPLRRRPAARRPVAASGLAEQAYRAEVGLPISMAAGWTCTTTGVQGSPCFFCCPCLHKICNTASLNS
jgi:hypothetical protein